MIKRLGLFTILCCIFAVTTSVTVAQRCGLPGLPACPPAAPTTAPPPPSIDDMDGDGVADAQDLCPTTGGPAWNSGCPLPEDSDGDGISDSEDACPEQGGSEQNNGCPEGATPANVLPPVISLPPIDPAGPCLIATQGTTPVNVRQTPELSAMIVGTLDPALTYPASVRLVISLPDNNIWYATAGGWVFAGVIRVEGDCSGVYTILQRSGDNEPETLSMASDSPVREIAIEPDNPLEPNEPAYLQRCTGENRSFNVFTEAQTIIQCDDESYSYDAQETLFECDGEILTDLDQPNPCIPELLEREEPDSGSNFGILLQSSTAAFIGVDFLLGYQPVDEGTVPPTANGACSSAYGVSVEGIEVVGFNPQPEPPPDPLFPVCMLLANGTDFGGENGPSLIIPLGAGRGLLLPPNAQVLTQNEFIIIINGMMQSAPMTPPPTDIDWFEIQYSNDLSLVIGSDGDTDYVCPVGANPPADGQSAPAIFNGVILVGFNPQPEPPAQEFVGRAQDINIFGFNPQPEPPAQELTGGVLPDFNIFGFNPQPEPPAQELTGGVLLDINIFGFNPQPEPPAQGVMGVAVPDVNIVGFNPQPEPPALCFEAAGI